MKSNQKVFIFLFVLIVLLILGVSGFIFYQNFNRKNQQKADNINPAPPAKNAVRLNPTGPGVDEIEWYNYSDSELGFSFIYPEGWEFVKGFGNGYVELDFKNPAKDALVIISVRNDGKFESEDEINNAISEREKEIKTNENYNVSSFVRSVRSDMGDYSAEGEENNFDFNKSNVDWNDIGFINYKFEEKGIYKKGGKSGIVHGFTIPGSGNEKVIKQILESFELK